MGESLAQLLALEGFTTVWCRDAAQAKGALSEQHFALVLSDIRLPDQDGGELFHELRAQGPTPPFVFMTAYGSIDRAVELLKAGAADYVTKPFDPEVLLHKVETLIEGYGVGIQGDTTLGVSPAMLRIAEQLPRLARHVQTLLILGESGVGKEHVARLFHRYAVGEQAPFVAVNCAAIPEGLIESEFFGHEKGAFTGADRSKRGYCEQAQGGTLFLDEIGEMPLSMQAKLLRVLQDRRVKRLGSEQVFPVDFRLVCATHRHLKTMVESGQFRADLYYRITVISLYIPPLRERPEDIRWFARRFIEDFHRAHGGPLHRLDPRTEQVLLHYHWPGNLRELKHAVERACILAQGPLLDAESFFTEGIAAQPSSLPLSQPLADYLMECERDYLLRMLERHGGHMTRTAAALGITRKTLWEKLRRLRIKAES